MANATQAARLIGIKEASEMLTMGIALLRDGLPIFGISDAEHPRLDPQSSG